LSSLFDMKLSNRVGIQGPGHSTFSVLTFNLFFLVRSNYFAKLSHLYKLLTYLI